VTNWRAVATLTFFYASVLAAQTAANWTQQNPQTSPPPRIDHAMAYDSAHGQVVLFGGSGQNGTLLNDTWVWDGSNWTRLFPQSSPPPRSNPAMAYDSAHSQVVLFGGLSFSAGSLTNTYLNDTWVWDGSNWTQEQPLVTVPPGRYGHAMAYDSAHGQVVLFGGATTNFTFLNDTWMWDGSQWTQESPQTSPPVRILSTLTYDSAHSQAVLFGGTGEAVFLGDTWLWDGSNWTLESPQTSPPGRTNHAAAFDSAHGQVVVFGGDNASPTFLNDTWVWDGPNWTEESPQTSPSVRANFAMAYDSTHGQVVMFGGTPAAAAFLQLPTVLGDTWTWIGAALPPTGPSISTVVSASAFGGFSSVAPGSWVEIYGSNLAPDTQGWTGADFSGNNAPTMLNGVSVGIGGQAAFIDYISASQVNAQLPSNIATGGPLQLTVTNANGTSTPVNVTVNPTEPGLLAPPSFKIGSNQYVVAQHSDGSYVLPVGAISGVTSSPAKPGEIVVIYGVGFGSVVPNIPAGEIVTETNQLSASFEILFGKTPAKVPYFGLAPSFVGLYQFNVTVPAVADNDLVPLTFNLGGVAGTQTLFTAVQQ
jgi:uncharacterized protein (TIGR03437 family)